MKNLTAGRIVEPQGQTFYKLPNNEAEKKENEEKQKDTERKEAYLKQKAKDMKTKPGIGM